MGLIAEDRAQFFEPCRDGARIVSNPHLFAIESQIRALDPGAKVRKRTDDGVANIDKMGRRHAIEENRMLDLRAVPDYTPLSKNRVSPNVRPMANRAIVPNDAGSLNEDARFDERICANGDEFRPLEMNSWGNGSLDYA